MANAGVEFAKVLTHPLGFAGYALFLLFGFLGSLIRLKSKPKRRWILPAAVVAAVVALAGGIGLAYRDLNHQVQETATHPVTPLAPAPTLQQQNDHPQINISGDKSPSVQGVQGDVHINYENSANEEHSRKTHKKAQKAKEAR